MTNRYQRGLTRLHVGMGFVAGTGSAWVVSEIVSALPLTLYFAYAALVVFVVVVIVDAWRLR